MSALRQSVIDDTLDQVKVVYLDRDTAKWWNSNRSPEDVAVFCGFYWIKGKTEGGPFKSHSSALRDAYYRIVLKTDVPTAGHSVMRPKSTKSQRQLRLRRDTASDHKAVAYT